MKTRIILFALSVILGVILLEVPDLVCGESQAVETAGPGNATPSPNDNAAILTLKTILNSVHDLREQIDQKEQELQLAKTEAQKSRVLKELTELNTHLAALTRDFQQIATGVNIEAFSAKPRQSFDWREELQDVLAPIVKELKNLTARPREVERLRGEVDYHQKQITTARNAVQNVQELILETQDQELRNALEAVEKKWKQKDQQLSGQLAAVHYQLAEKLKEQRPFLESFQNLMMTFFKSRGRNFILALAAFVLVLFLFRLLQRLIYRLSPLGSPRERGFYARLWDLLYQVLAFAGATGASVLVLYAAGDWLLLSFAVLLLLGMIWTARQTLPKFWTQAKFLLNLGTVRENERIVYQGIPWLVQSLNFYTQLHNPQLKGGVLRLPLQELMGLRSRPYDFEEPWFPTNENEWVMLADGTLGRVVLQSPEMVELRLVGGSRKTYPTADFLRQNPNNISKGFRLSTTLRLDYQHQAESTREIPERLKQAAWRELRQEEFAKDILSFRVEFKEPQSSSLDLAILVDCAGKAAKYYDQLTRTIPRIAVEACNKFGWVIPFPQVTIHTGGIAEEPPEDAESSPAPAKARRRWSLWR